MKTARVKMVRTQLYLAPDQYAWLRRQSKSTDYPKAYFIREAIRHYAHHQFGDTLEPEPSETTTRPR
jgi:predicted DNA-binding protein